MKSLFRDYKYCSSVWVGLWSLFVVGATISATVSFLQTGGRHNRISGHSYYAESPASEWILIGGVTDSSAVVRVYLEEEKVQHHDADDGYVLKLAMSTDPSLPASNRVYESDPIVGDSSSIPHIHGIRALQVGGLQPNTRYHYGLVVDDKDDNNATIRLPGQFRTPTPAGTPWNFTVALGGCAKTGSQRAVFDVIRTEHQPDLFLHLGDFHYEDNACNCMDKRLDAVHTVLNSRPQAELYRSTALVGMWDDHDWLDNNSDAEEKEEGAHDTALRSYQILFPHYPLAAATSPNGSFAVEEADIAPIAPYHAFTLGTVRFIVTDLRSECTDTAIYSDQQWQWLQQELSQAANYDFVVWVTTKPYIGVADLGADRWAGQVGSRRALSEFISQHIGKTDGPQNLIAVSADAHMLAFDDGTNTYYGETAETVAPSFPILQSGPLDNYGSAKGGPFTEGCFSKEYQRNHQFSTIRFEFPAAGQTTGEACMNIDAHRVDDVTRTSQVVFSKRLCGQIFSHSHVGVREGTCDIELLPKTSRFLLGLSFALALVTCAVVGYFFRLRSLQTLWIVGFVGGSCIVTLVLGLGLAKSRGYHAVPIVAVLSVALGQCFAMDVWIAFRAPRADSKLVAADTGGSTKDDDSQTDNDNI